MGHYGALMHVYKLDRKCGAVFLVCLMEAGFLSTNQTNTWWVHQSSNYNWYNKNPQNLKRMQEDMYIERLRLMQWKKLIIKQLG